MRVSIETGELKHCGSEPELKYDMRMSKPLRITSPDNARVGKVLKLRKHRERRATGLFIAEGPREVTRAAAANLTLRQVYLCRALVDKHAEGRAALEPVLAALDDAVERFDVSEPVLVKMAYRQDPEGVLAVVEQPHWSWEDLPPVTDRTLYLVAVGTAKPGNLGAMVRTADAAGCEAVLAAGSSVDTFNPNAIRNSTGAVFSLPTISTDDQTAIAYLLSQRVRIVAATAVKGGTPHSRADLIGPLAVAIGPEDTGLPRAWLEAAEAGNGLRVTIAMRPGTVDSLNASSAAAVLLFEALRQRA